MARFRNGRSGCLSLKYSTYLLIQLASFRFVSGNSLMLSSQISSRSGARDPCGSEFAGCRKSPTRNEAEVRKRPPDRAGNRTSGKEYLELASWHAFTPKPGQSVDVAVRHHDRSIAQSLFVERKTGP